MAETTVGYRVVAAYPDRDRAETAAKEAVSAGGRAESVTFDGADDEKRSMLGEMQDEMQHNIAGPGVGPFTKEMTKSMALLVPIGGAVGLAVGLVAALVPISGWTLLSRLVTYGLIGATAGGTIGFLVGGGVGSKGPSEPMASDRGVVVGVTADSGASTEAVEAAMAAHDPIRVDVFSWNHGHVSGYHQVAATEEDPSMAATGRDLAHKATQHDGEPDAKRVPDTPPPKQ